MIDTQGEVSLPISSALAVLAPSLADGELISAQAVFGTEIARADAIGTSEKPRGFLRTKSRQISTELERLVGFAQRHPDVARERVVPRQTFIRALQNDYVLFASQRIDD